MKDIGQKRNEVVITFEENLKLRRLSQAGQQLIQVEERLFGRDTENKEKGSRKEEVEKLKTDYEALLDQMRLAVEASLCAGPEDLEALRAAVSSMQQEERQDERWREEPGAEAPAWRPRRCRQSHDTLLQSMVEGRMSNTEEVSGGDNLSSSLKRDLCKMGLRVKEDLLKVARDVKRCYPKEIDICNMYATLYHQAFSAHLKEITDFGLDVEDCIYLLSWVNDYYPNDILKHKELAEEINCESLKALLPEEVARPLEEQYLSHKEMKVKTWVSAALKKEEASWLSGAMPELRDKHYISSIAIDVIQLIDAAVREASTILGELSKARSIMCQLKSFLMSYKRCLGEFMKGKRGNTKAVIKANLTSIEQFRDYIVRKADLFSEEMKSHCLSVVTDMEDSCYLYLSRVIHEDLKPRYRKLGTQAWLTGNSLVLMEVLEGVKSHTEACKDLKTSCFEELLGRLHTEVTVEYVKRLLKRKLRLKDRVQQETAAKLLCEDNTRLHTFFTEEGSKQEWLGAIIPKIAEVLKVQDPGFIQLEVVTLARDYPDLSECHVSALLYLKYHLYTSDIKRIKESLRENRQPVGSDSSRIFFSRVTVKSKIM
ncbi:tumor necrosis factor alpha-induced protein 2a [Megalops cyprinoides]|uniref:tumor necrosis factor alpha-induced protein 2a n=1 Tax=Megalops cyprinoides TaxID=118141 RepID=UPI001863D91A|nr:tumor necrosis factor alpha-induced protein 2a [Megalops cyprinoides]